MSENREVALAELIVLYKVIGKITRNDMKRWGLTKEDHDILLGIYSDLERTENVGKGRFE